MRQAAALLAVLVGVGLTLAAAAPAERAALKVECKLAGIHYVGTSTQRQKVCLTLSANGKVLKEYSFGGRFKCNDGTRDVGVTHIKPNSTDISVGGVFLIGAGVGSKKITDVGKDGKFADVPGYEAQSIFSGQIKNKTVAGILRQRVKFRSPPSADIVCDSGKASWSARRAVR